MPAEASSSAICANVLDSIHDQLAGRLEDRLIVVNLDEADKVIGFQIVALGEEVRSVREAHVFSSTLLCGADGIVLVRVCSGIVPEKEGRDAAARMARAAEFFEVRLVDYVVVDGEGRRSFAKG